MGACGRGRDDECPARTDNWMRTTTGWLADIRGEAHGVSEVTKLRTEPLPLNFPYISLICVSFPGVGEFVTS